MVYDSAPHMLTVTNANGSGTQYADGAEVTISEAHYYDNASYTGDYTADSPVNVGTYYVKVVVTAGENYNACELGRAADERHITITPRSIRIVWTNTANYTGVYNGQQQGRMATVMGIQGDDELTFTASNLSVGATSSVEGNVITFTAKNASLTTYSGTLNNPSGAKAANYEWLTSEYVEDPTGPYIKEGGVYHTFTRYSIVTSESGTYIKDDGNYVLLSSYTTYSDTEGTEDPEGAYIRLSNGNYVTIASRTKYTITESASGTYILLNSGEYVLLSSCTRYKFYNYATAESRTCEWTVSKSNLTFDLAGETGYEYNKEDQGATLVITGLVEGEKLTFTYTFSATNTSVTGMKVNGESVASSASSRTVTVGDTFAFTGLNATGYAISVTNVVAGANTDLNNYNFSWANLAKNFTINKKKLALEWSVSDGEHFAQVDNATVFTATYNGNTWSPSATLDGIYDGDSAAIGSLAFNNTALNVDDYTVTATLISGTENYEIDGTYVTCIFHLVPVQVEYAWYRDTDMTVSEGGTEYDFDGDTHYVYAVAAETYVEGETLSFTYTGASARNVNRLTADAAVGSYTATITDILVNGVHSGNYQIAGGTAELVWKILPVAINVGDENDITVTISSSITYDAAQHTANLNTFATRYGDEVTYVFSYISAGAYVIDANGNYARLKSGNGDYFYFTPTKYSYEEVETEEGTEWQYVSNESGTYYYVVGGYILITDFNSTYNRYSIASSSAAPYNVGSYQVYATVKNPNYNVLTTASVDFVIVKANITGLTLSDETEIYNHSTHTLEMYNDNTASSAGTRTQYYALENARGEAAVITYTKYFEKENGAYALVEGAMVAYDAGYGDITRYAPFTNATNAGTYRLLIVADAGDNYNEKILTATLTISPKTIRVTWTAEDNTTPTPNAASGSGTTFTTTYNGKDWSLNGSVANGATSPSDYLYYTGDTVSVNYDGAHTFTNADSYTVTAMLTGASAGNYVLDSTATATLTIEKRTLHLTWTTYDEADDRNTLSAVNGSVVYDKYAHGIIVTIADDDIISGDTVTFTYTTNVESNGGVSFSASSRTATYSSVNVCIVNSAVAAYSISFSAVDDDNYAFTTVTKTFTINKAAIISDNDIYANNATYTYDKTVKSLPLANGNGTGLTRYGDAITATFTYYSDSTRTTLVAAPTNAGTYYGKLALTAGTNYIDLTGEDAIVENGAGADLILTINKADITGVTLPADSVAYDGYTHSIAIVNANEEGMTQYADSIVSITYKYFTNAGRTSEAASVKNAAKYYTRATIDAGDNYNALVLDSEYDITPKAVTLMTNYTRTPDRENRLHYAGVQVGVTPSVDGVVDGETAAFSALEVEGLTRSGNTFTALNVGTYTVTVSLVNNGTFLASNYALTGGNTVTFVITPVKLYGEWVNLTNGALTYGTGADATVAQLVYSYSEQGVKLNITKYYNEDDEEIVAPSGSYTIDYTGSSAIDVLVDGEGNVIARTATATGIRILGALTDNYTFYNVYSINWKINKADLDPENMSFANATYIYDTTTRSIIVTGETQYGESADVLGFSYTINRYTEAAEGAYVLVDGSFVPYVALTHSGLTRYNAGVASSGNGASNAGVYEVTVSGITNTNYAITGSTFDSAVLTINKAAITGLTFADTTVTYNGETQFITVTPSTTQYGDAALSVTYTISSADDAVADVMDRTHGAKNVLLVNGEVAGRLITASVTAGDNYIALTGATALTATLRIEPIQTTVVWKSYANHATSLTLSGSVAQFTYNGSAQGVFAVLTTASSVVGETPVAVYDTSATNLGNFMTDVYRVDGTPTAKTARIIGFTVGEDASPNYALASGASATQTWIINPAYMYYKTGTNGLFYLNDSSTPSYSGLGNYLVLRGSSATDSYSASAVTAFAGEQGVKPSSNAYDASTRTSLSEVTSNVAAVYYYTTDSSLSFSLADLTGWTNMESGVFDAGTYYVVAVVEDNNFVTFVSRKATFVVNKFIVTDSDITWTHDGSYVYNGNDRGASVTASFDGPAAVGELTFSVSADNLSFTKNSSEASFLNADDYLAVLDTTDFDTNYDFSGATLTKAFSITPAPLTASWANSANWTGTYFKTAQGRIATIEGLVGEEVLTVNWRFVVGGIQNNGSTSARTIEFFEASAGTHTATVLSFSDYNGALASNYAWGTVYVEDENGTYKYEGGVYSLIEGEYAGTRYSVSDYKTMDVSIAKKVINVSWQATNAGNVYTEFPVTYNKGNYTLTVSYEVQGELSDDAEDGLVCYGETPFDFNYTNNENNLAGDYTTSVVSQNTNYEVSAATRSIDWSISPKTITVKTPSLIKYYDGTATKELALSDLTGVESGDSFTSITMTYASRHIASGTIGATFALEGGDSANYVIEDVATATILALNGSNLSWSGTNVVYNAYEQIVQATIDLLGDDRVDFETSQLVLTAAITRSSVTVAYKNAGNYTATVSRPATLISAEDWTQLLADYGILTSALTTSATIDKYPVEGITWTGDGASYYYNGEDQKGNITAGFLLLGDDTGSLVPVIRRGGNVVTNFDIAGSYTFTIDPDNLGDSDVLNNYTITGVADEQKSRSITMNKASLENYLIFEDSDSWTYFDGTPKSYYVTTYTVDPAGDYVFADGYYVTYNAGIHGGKTRYSAVDVTFGTASSTIKFPYDDITMSFTYVGGDFAENTIKNAGVYTITATVAETANYDGWTSSVEVEVLRGEAAFFFLDEYASDIIDVTYKGSEYYVYAASEGGTVYYVASVNGEYASCEIAGETRYIPYASMARYNVSASASGLYILDGGAYVLLSSYTRYDDNEGAVENNESGEYICLANGTYVQISAQTKYAFTSAEAGAYVMVDDTPVSYSELAAAAKYTRMINYLNSRALNYRDGTNANITYEISTGDYVYLADADGDYLMVAEDEYVLISDMTTYVKEGEEPGEVTYTEDPEGTYYYFDGSYALLDELSSYRYVRDFDWTPGNSAKDVLKDGEDIAWYIVRAHVDATGNYNAWTKIGYLRINPLDTRIVYMSAGVPVEYVDFEYCGVDQAPTLNAYITALGGDGTLSTDGTGNKIWLNLGVENVTAYEEAEEGIYVCVDGEYVRYVPALHSELTRYNALTSAPSDHFQEAGNYKFVSKWYTRDEIIAQADEGYAALYATYINNYNVTNYSLDITMKKRSAEINWYSDSTYHTLYDDTAFTYDGENHTVYALGTTIQVADQEANGDYVYLNDTLVAYDAATHGTHIQLYSRSANVYTLKTLTAEDGDYFFYSEDGVEMTPWSELTGEETENDAYVYYKDGSTYYRVNTLCVYNPIFRRYVAFAGDFGPYAENYGVSIQRFGEAHYDTIALDVNTTAGAGHDATTQRNAGRYYATISEISGADEDILKNYNVNASRLALNWVINERMLEVTVDADISMIYDKTTTMVDTNSVLTNAAAGTRTYTYRKGSGEAAYTIVFSNIPTSEVTTNFLTDFSATADDANVDDCTSAEIVLTFAYNRNYTYKVKIGDGGWNSVDYASGTVSASGTYTPDTRTAISPDEEVELYRIYNGNVHSMYVPSLTGDFVKVDCYKNISTGALYLDSGVTAPVGSVYYNGPTPEDKYFDDGESFVRNDEIGTYYKGYTYVAYDAVAHEDMDRFALNRFNVPTITFTTDIDATIDPLPITLSWTEENALVYNGTEQVGREPVITNIVTGDTVNMTVNYNGVAYDSATAPTNAGAYTTSVIALDNTNYTITGDTITSDSWTITKRGVKVDFNAFVQSWTQAAWETISVTDFELLGSDTAAKTALITIDSLTNASFTVELMTFSTARTAAGGAMGNYNVNGADGVISITINDNYEVSSDRKLTVSALGKNVDTNETYSFNVTNASDISILTAESAALEEAGIAANVITYTQTADISGIVSTGANKGSYNIHTGPVVTRLYGNYVGTGHTISNFMIVGSGEKLGFFGEVTGTITGVDLRYVTVISTGAGAEIGSIAATANEIVSSTAQGNIYVSGGTNVAPATVGLLAASTSGEVTDSKAAGYIKVLGGTVTVGGAVGVANDDITAYTFVEINKLNASAVITAGGIAGSVANGVTVAGTYLEGSFGGLDLEGSDEVISDGTLAISYADILAETEDEAIIALRDELVSGYVMKGFYVGAVQASYTIKNYRQLAIMEMYSWADFTLGADICLPRSYGNGVHAGEFTYQAINENGKKIYIWSSSDDPDDDTFMGISEEVR